jgi:hypothetical protein
MRLSEIPLPILAALIGIIGALVGATATAVFTSWREKGSRERKNLAVRQMIRTEIEHNLSQLQAWETGTPLPVQSHQVWQNLLELVPGAFKPAQIAPVHRFYYDLYGLKKLQESQSPALAETVAQLRKMGNPISAADA